MEENVNMAFDEQEVVEEKKKVSPFADSPYVTAVQPQIKSRPVQKKTKASKGGCLSWFLGGIAVVVCCTLTALVVSGVWNAQLQNVSNVFQAKLNVQEQKINALLDNAGNAGAAVGDDTYSPALVYAKNVDTVVAISSQAISTNIYGQISETASSGSGVIVSDKGYVITNYHVIQGANTLQVITSDGQEHNAQLIGYDMTNDIAVLKIEGENYPFAVLGSSDELVVGEQVVAIGNPLGELTSTLTVGYISAKDRMVDTGNYINMLQTDAAINSGNSGGPLFNMNGEVVGITTAKYSGVSNSGATIEGIGFAIPIDDVLGIIEDLVAYGRVNSAYLGVTVRDVDPTVSQMYGIPSGALVDSVSEGSCAEKAGLQPKDVITKLGDYEVGSLAELSRTLRRFEPGQTAVMQVYRSGKMLDLEITFDEKPQETQLEETQPQQPDQQELPQYDDGDSWFGNMFPDFGSMFPGFGG